MDIHVRHSAQESAGQSCLCPQYTSVRRHEGWVETRCQCQVEGIHVGSAGDAKREASEGRGRGRNTGIPWGCNTTMNVRCNGGCRQTGKGDGQGRRGAWQGRRGAFGGERLFARLNLTDDQKAKLKQIRQSFMESNKPLFEQMRAKRQELRQASEGGTFNEALATQKLTEAAGLEAKLMGARFQLHQQELSVLTPEQKTQLDQLKAQFKANHGQRRGQGGPRGDE